ncbi:hypothetical protein BZG01_11755 [Labilibaculum manganireducens]|uniref:Uncharacterized protein n=1 Tax=Labilibaculum manganireducens TaxID=1940525 RepID=A0A2N3I7H8_9BACT|nr:hypothetical protein [Labilibaculum manganireducens]PKQ66261.1 hypothetical protein BZG01_11755 [Labilibaculum manganireducens]
MATLLRDKMSSESHISYSERHVRLCQQTKGAESLVRNIQPKIENLQSKVDVRSEKVKLRYSAYDAIVLNDGVLDDSIKNLADSAKQYDRSTPGRSVYQVLFPDGPPSNITDASFSKEIEKAGQLLVRLQSLGEGHALLSYVEILSAAIDASRQAIAAHQVAVSDENTAFAGEKLAQAALRKQYEFNYLDAVKLLGKNHANRLFPKPSGGKKKVAEEVVNEAEAL